ncbi:uncharacterized protein LACBIDRAFT_307621 [Laccaria bicolor S238N-H82]|uniref:Predicted protein n=1 Tax=Laccaria bicolor (strain S238N-H82 / ATCC MYA-4686) TaxID=486041 RepID=B0DQL3_LACBS|nr:uncharacterized protein LACBIDRAFT_307621 [Laccaria bicolor S238N-H82]EDR03137.1 predicted protein [Laccaria bicolor S238N-H82]|eukprot:XP_001886278.1 predicted protein [Laccaria bicolor S238N-H82]
MLVSTRLPALILAVAYLAIAAPSSSGARVPAGADTTEVVDTHLTIEEKGGSTVEPDSTTCYVRGDYCQTDSDCCGRICYPFAPEMVYGFCY